MTAPTLGILIVLAASAGWLRGVGGQAVAAAGQGAGMSELEREFLVNLATLLFLLASPAIAVIGAALYGDWRADDE